MFLIVFAASIMGRRRIGLIARFAMVDDDSLGIGADAGLIVAYHNHVSLICIFLGEIADVNILEPGER